MTDDRLKELIPDVKTDFEHNALNVYVNRETLQQQTENLRKAVKAFDDLCDLLTIEDLGPFANGYNISMKNFCIETIEQITGKKYSEI